MEVMRNDGLMAGICEVTHLLEYYLSSTVHVEELEAKMATKTEDNLQLASAVEKIFKTKS